MRRSQTEEQRRRCQSRRCGGQERGEDEDRSRVREDEAGLDGGPIEDARRELGSWVRTIPKRTERAACIKFDVATAEGYVWL